MPETNQKEESVSLKEIFGGLEKRLEEVQGRIQKRDELRRLLISETPTSEILKVSKKEEQNRQIVDNPLYLLEIRDFLKNVVEEIGGLKNEFEGEKEELEKIVKSYETERSVVACFSALESLDLEELEKQIKELQQVAPKYHLLKAFQEDLKMLQEFRDSLTEEQWKELKKLGIKINSDSVSEDHQQLMDLVADHTDISIFSQWYQQSRLWLLQKASESLFHQEKLHALESTIQDARMLVSREGYIYYEEEYWASLEKLDEMLRNSKLLSSLVENDDIRNSWRQVLEETIDRVMAIEKKQKLGKKRQEEWRRYQEAVYKLLARQSPETDSNV